MANLRAIMFDFDGVVADTRMGIRRATAYLTSLVATLGSNPFQRPMKEQLISFETAKLAKEKGFEFRTPNAYVFRYKEHEKEDYQASITKKPLVCDIPAPTQSLLQKWLRDVHELDVYVSCIQPKEGYIWNIFGHSTTNIPFRTYEEALEAGLQKSLKLINND